MSPDLFAPHDLAGLHLDPVPMNKPDPATFYGEGPSGYTDYPALAAAA